MNHRAIKLRELIDNDNRFNGSQKAFADKIGVTAGSVNHWLTGHRKMKDTTAREIEIKVGYESGWFEKSREIPLKPFEVKLSDLEAEALQVFRNLPNNEERKLAIDTMRLRVNDQSDSRGHTTTKKRA